MFLAIEEMKQNKLRYGLIFGLLVLVAYLVFFLTGLAYGLMQQNRAAVDKWQADTVVLSKDADKLLASSHFEEALADEVSGDETATLFYQTSLVAAEGDDREDKERAALFGLATDSFVEPNIVEGRAAKDAFEVVVDQSLLESLDLSIGDQLILSDTDQALTVVGTTNHATISVAPVIYLAQEDYKTLFPTALPNAVLVQGDLASYPEEELDAVSLADFINKLPGYKAQNLTFGFMIGFLVVIAAVIIGIFIYVLTTQKAPIFGLMKIQGLSTSYIARSVLGQTLVLAGLGTLVGLGLTYGSSLVLPAAVPFENFWPFYGVIAAALVGFSLLGASFSIGAIAKVDPLKHIG